MRPLLAALTMIISFAAFAQEQDWAFVSSSTYSDSLYLPFSHSKASSVINYEFEEFHLSTILSEGKAIKKILGYSEKKQPIDMFYFPGTSTKKALVIGGIHGSELPSVEVANRLVKQLSAGPKPYYSVIIIPVLFPDNAHTATISKGDRVLKNTGRYTSATAIDPNRQFPGLGKPFLMNDANDAYGRTIEKENALLLQLIQAYEPERIVSIHAIRDQSKAGVYADPRTDCEGRALGYSSDSTLAVLMARHIDDNCGNAFGNKIKNSPTALYYLDPKVALPGQPQQRNLTGANMMGKINGVSLGSWASTAVCDETTAYHRDAMRILTMEFPGYKIASEYRSKDDKNWYTKQVELYSSAIHDVFLQAYCVEETERDNERLVL